MQYLWARRLPPTHNQPAGPHPRLSLAGLPRPATHLQVEICHTLHKKFGHMPHKNVQYAKLSNIPYAISTMHDVIYYTKCSMQYAIYTICYAKLPSEYVPWDKQHRMCIMGISNLYTYIYTHIYIYIYIYMYYGACHPAGTDN
jgi:hypothetical protein